MAYEPNPKSLIKPQSLSDSRLRAILLIPAFDDRIKTVGRSTKPRSLASLIFLEPILTGEVSIILELS